MLFDLKGRRRRVVQGTYLLLAVLMGGGLLLFGIGGEVQGGLVDAFTGSSSDSSDAGSGLIADRVEGAEERLRTNPRDAAALTAVIRGRYQLATSKTAADSATFPPESRGDLSRASDAWQRYLALDLPRRDSSLAGLMLQVYGEFGLNRPDKAAEAAEIVAEARPSAASYLALAQYATLAGQKRKAELAGGEALKRASKSDRKVVKEQIAALEALSKPQSPGGSPTAPAAPGGAAVPPTGGPPTPTPGGGGATPPGGSGAPPQGR